MMSAPISELSQATRILLLAHDPSSRLLLNDYLTHHGHQVLSLTQGSSFPSALVQFQPHVVLLDLNSSGISKHQLLEEMRQQPGFQNLPVIVITGFASQTKYEQAVRLRASHYFIKPIQPELLVKSIKEACACSPPLITIGSIQ